MNYKRIQKMLQLIKKSRVDYHLAMAAAAAHEEKDERRDPILEMMRPEARDHARRSK